MKVKRYLIGVKVIPVYFEVDDPEEELTMDKLVYHSQNLQKEYSIVATIFEHEGDAQFAASEIITRSY